MKRSRRSLQALGRIGLFLLLGACSRPGASSGPPVNVASPEGATGALGEAAGAPSAPLVSHIEGMMPVGLTTLGAAVHGDSVYVLGGFFGRPHAYSKADQSQDFSRYDLGTRRWEKLAPQGPIQSAALVSDGRYVYRVGGMRALNEAGQPENMQSLDEVARFDPSTGAWQAMPSLPAGRSSHQAVLYGTRLYVVGGWKLSGKTDDHEWQDTLLSCDLSAPECKWESEPVPFSTRAMGAAVYKDKIYVLGGLTPASDTDEVQVYDLKTRKWSLGPEFPKGNITITAAVFGDRLYANGADGKVYRLAADGQSWEVAGALDFPRTFHQLVTGPKGLMVLGGIPAGGGGARIRHIETVSAEPRAPGVVWTLPAQSPAKNRQGAFLVGQQLYVFGGNNSLEQHDFGKDNFLDTALRLDLGALTWKPVASFPAKRQSMQSVVIGTEEKPVALAIGGFGFQGDALGTQSHIIAYDVKANTWAPYAARLPEPRSQFGVTEWKGALWVFGGLDFGAGRKEEFKHSASVSMLDLAHPEGGFVPAGVDLKEPRRAFAGARLDSRYYVTGGMKEDFAPVTTCEVLDLDAKVNRAMACPSSHRLGGQLVPLGGKLYLVGGSANDAKGERAPTGQIEVYEPAADRWSTLATPVPLEPPAHLTAFAFREQLLVYSAQRSNGSVQVALLDPVQLAAGRRDFANIEVPAP